MSSARLLALSALLPLTVACQSAFAAQAGGAPKVGSAGLLPPAKQPIEVRVEPQQTMNLAELVQLLSAATGVQFTANEPVRQMLAQTPCGLGASVTIPPGEAWKWVESLLLHNGFMLGVLSTDAPQLAAIYSVNQHDSGKRVMLRVDEAELGLLEEHPAVLIVTWLDLPHIDVRQLGNSLRGLTTDPTGTQNVVPVGGSNSVLLTGTAREVSALWRMLRDMHAVAAETAKARTAPTPAGATPGGQPLPR